MNDNYNKNIEKILSDFKKISLTEAERTAMFSNIDKFVATNPRKIKKSIETPYFSWSFFAVHTKGLAFAMVIFIILGSTSAAAQYALPGEMLYGVKVNINEEVLSLLSTSDFTKAKFESQRAKERLKEASVLARNGKLSGEVKEKIEVKLTEHIAEVQENVAKFKKEGNLNDALALGTDLEVTLRSSEDELAGISSEVAVTDDTQIPSENNKNQDNQHLSELVLAVAEEIEKTSVARIDTETNISDSKNDETIKIAAQTKRDAALKVLASIELSSQPEENAEENSDSSTTSEPTPLAKQAKNEIGLMMASAPAPTQTREEIIAQIKIRIEEGERYLNSKMYKEAFDSFNAAFELENSLQVKEGVREEESIQEPVSEVRGIETIRTNIDNIHIKGFDKKKEL